jgi:hypothetical protein
LLWNLWFFLQFTFKQRADEQSGAGGEVIAVVEDWAAIVVEDAEGTIRVLEEGNGVDDGDAWTGEGLHKAAGMEPGRGIG